MLIGSVVGIGILRPLIGGPWESLYTAIVVVFAATLLLSVTVVTIMLRTSADQAG
jgi:hypothetical protein